MKKWMVLMLCLILIPMVMLPVAALEKPDLSRTGSVSITMTYRNKPVTGGTLTLIRVAEIREENGADYSFRLLESYATSGVSAEDMSNDTAVALASYTEENKLSGQKKKVNAQGEVTFTDLELGLYLVLQEDAAPGYALASPFLVSVPGRQDDRYVYQVDASPKLELETVPTEPTDPPTEPSKPPKLPQTGQTQWPVPFMGILGAILVVTGIVMRTLGRKSEHEE